MSRWIRRRMRRRMRGVERREGVIEEAGETG